MNIVHEMQPQQRASKLKPAGYRTGMWLVDDEGRVAIAVRYYKINSRDEVVPLNEIEQYLPDTLIDCVELALVDEQGDTVVHATDVVANWKQAALADIPECRRPSNDVAQQLGYL